MGTGAGDGGSCAVVAAARRSLPDSPVIFSTSTCDVVFPLNVRRAGAFNRVGFAVQCQQRSQQRISDTRLHGREVEVARPEIFLPRLREKKTMTGTGPPAPLP